MTEKINLPDEVRELFRSAGSRGGQTTAKKHGPDFFRRISAKGAKARARKSQQSQTEHGSEG